MWHIREHGWNVHIAERGSTVNTGRHKSGYTAFALIACCAAVFGSCGPFIAKADTTGTSVSYSTTPSSVAITIDDLPYVKLSQATPKEGLGYVRSINQALDKHSITATGFAVGSQVNKKTLPALRAFAGAGHTVGNHSWSHPDYGTLTPEQFRAETRRTDELISKWIDGPKYYRFPFLKEGATKEAKSVAKDILTQAGYLNVPVTIDNDEWQLKVTYTKALWRGDTVTAAKVADQYLAHMKERTVHFQTLARSELDRDVKHVFLFHLNKINADHLETLLDWYAVEAWSFITVAEAMADPVYSARDRYNGARGISQIERVIGRKSD